MTAKADKAGVSLHICQTSWFEKNKTYFISNPSPRTSDLSFSGADLNYFARCLYGESSGSQSLPDINDRKSEKEALVNVFYFRLNRKGYPTNRYIATSFTMVCDARNQFQSIQPTPSPKLRSSAPGESSHLNKMECADLQECIDAITTFLAVGPNNRYVYDNFRSRSSGTHGVVIGGSRFWLSPKGKELADANP
ncbi:hypothetical protein [Paraburkholderia sp.]|uniref:hypothetical protein n=1 Tax=Paraburkholderia sp. TaxID=1926495 RepID=UPI002F42893F